MSIAPLPAAAFSSPADFERVAADPRLSDEQKVRESARQFESILLHQILAETRKTVLTADEEGSSTVKSIYDDVINQVLADNISRSGGLGLARSLELQLTHQILPAATGQTSTTVSPPAVTHD